MERTLLNRVEWMESLDHRNPELMSIIKVSTWENADGSVETHMTLDNEYTNIWAMVKGEEVMIIDMDVTKVTTSEQNRSIGNFLNLVYQKHFVK